MRRLRSMLAAGMLAMGASPAFAGPPYITDDPEPTDPGHWEIYAFTDGTRTAGDWEGAAGFDINYGAAKDVQITITAPIDFAQEGGLHSGPGDIELAIKYRFHDSEAAHFSIAAFPRLIVPTAGRRFGSGRAALLLPVWAQKDFGPWSLFGGGGYMINPGAGNHDFWESGLVLSRTISPRLSLGGEIAWQGADRIDGHDYAALNLGGVYHLGGPFALLVSGGPGIVHHRERGAYNAYAALGMNF